MTTDAWFLALCTVIYGAGVVVGYRWQPGIKKHLVDKHFSPSKGERSHKSGIPLFVIVTHLYTLVMFLGVGIAGGYQLRSLLDEVDELWGPK